MADVIVKFLQVNPKIKSSDIEEYFEKKAQCFVSSIVNLSDGNCELHLSGISDKLLTTLLQDKHNLKGYSLTLQLVSKSPLPRISESGVLSFGGTTERSKSDSSTTPDIIGTSIKVSGLPANISDDDIELYFEIDKSGGKKGSVKKCTVEKCGVAYVDFHSSEVAANVVSKGDHKLLGRPLEVSFLSSEQMAKKHKLLLTQLPSEIDIEFLMAVLERDLGTAEFSLQMSDKCSAAVVIFHITYTNTEIEAIIRKLERRQLVGKSFKVCQLTSSSEHTTWNEDVSTLVKVTGLPTTTSHEEIEVYFETARSGGKKGSIKKCVIKQSGIAMIKFEDQVVAADVVSRGDHKLFGYPLVVQYASSAEMNKLILTQLPSEIEMEYLRAALEKALGTAEFALEIADKCSAAVIIFLSALSDAEIERIIATLESRKIVGASLNVQQIKEILTPSSDHAGKTVAANVVSKGDHKLLGRPLEVSFLSSEQMAKKHKLLLTQLPSEIDIEFLMAVLERDLGTAEFSLQMSDKCSAAVVIFHIAYTNTEIEAIIRKLERRQLVGKSFKVCQLTSSSKHTTWNEDVSTLVKVTGLPTTTSHEEIEVYFETARSGGKKGSIKKCVIKQSGIAMIKFEDQVVAADVVSRGDHKLFGFPLVVQYASSAEMNKLILTQLPSEIEMEYLRAALEKALGTAEFALEIADKCSAAVIIFLSALSDAEIERIIATLQSRKIVGASLNVQQIKEILTPSSDYAGKTESTTERNEEKRIKDMYLKSERTKTVATSAASLTNAGGRPTTNDVITGDKMSYDRRGSPFEDSAVKSSGITGPGRAVIVDPGSSSVLKGLVPSNQQVLLTDLPAIDIEHLQLHLAKVTKLQCGDDFLLEQRANRTVIITFKRLLLSADLDCFIANVNKTVIKSTNLKAEILNNEQLVKPPEYTPRLLLLDLPDDTDRDHLKLIIEKASRMNIGQGLSLDVMSSKAAAIFSKFISDNELENVIASIQKQLKTTITATQIKTSNLIIVSHIDQQYYDKQFLLSYFENQKHSGGGPVESIKLCGNGKAMVIFQDQEVVSHVLTSHCKFGMEICTVTPLEAFKLWSAAAPGVDPCSDPGSGLDGPDMEKCFSLKQEDFEFVSQAKYSCISKTFPLLSVQFTSPNIVVSGPSFMIHQFEKQLQSLSSHTSVPTDLQPFFPFLKSAVGTKLLQNFICMHNCPAVVYTASNAMYLLCDNDEVSVTSAAEAAAAIHKELLCKNIPICKSHNMEFSELCQKIMADHKVHISFDSNNATLIGFKDDVNNSADIMHSFIKKHSESHDYCLMAVTLDNGIWKLLQSRSWWKSVISGKETQISDSALDTMTSTITICGPPDIAQVVNSRIAKFKSDIKKTQIIYTKPVHIESSAMKSMVSQIESRHDVSIAFQMISNYEPRAADALSNDKNGSVNASCNNVYVVRTKENKKIAVWVGDITNFKADVMVNAANEDLKHIGGVALAIADKGGSIIQESSDAYIREHRRPLKVGEVFITTAVGSLPCKALVHAVGPKWHGGCNNEERLLFSACLNSLLKAADYTSIVLPAISGGIFGYPFLECAETLFKGVIEFSSRHPTVNLNEINFILSGQLEAKKFIDVAQKNVSFGLLLPDATSSTFLQCALPEKFPKYKSNISDYLHLHKGSLLDINADVYVNSTTPNLDLTFGQVSLALSRAAGSSFAQECSRKGTTRKVPGEVTVTGGGGTLKCKHVFHVVLKPYENFGQESDEIFKKAVNNCLEECAKRNLSSIAFPALGTGNFNFPIHVAAQLLINEAVQFSKSHEKCSVSKIYLVSYTNNDFDTFQTILKQFKYGTTVSSILNPNLPGGGRNNDSSFCIGGLVVEIACGDITDEQTNAIVNSTNRDMHLTSGVAAALLKKAGPGLQHECNECTTHGSFLECGNVIMTSAYGLKCNALFHTNFKPEQLEVSILNCLRKAEVLAYISISFPALGTGLHAIRSETAANVMIEAIKKFCKSSLHLKLIRIIISQSEIYQSFLKTFHSSGLSSITTSHVPDTELLRPTAHGPVKTTGSLETACFNIYGESLQKIEFAAQELNKSLNAINQTECITSPLKL